MTAADCPWLTAADNDWMAAAIKLAELAKPKDIPFGCIIVDPDGHSVANTWGTGNVDDPTQHSELQAIRWAVRVLPNVFPPAWLHGYSIYSTHEPCIMCVGAINHAKISRVVFGSYRHDLPDIFRPNRGAKLLLTDTSHPPKVFGGVRRGECVELFKDTKKWD